MKRPIVTMIASLCAGAAFAQATPPAAAPSTTAPQSAVPPEVAKAQAGHDKDAAKAEAKSDAKSDTKGGKKPAARKARKAAPAKVQDKSKMPVDEQNTTASTVAAAAPDVAR